MKTSATDGTRMLLNIYICDEGKGSIAEIITCKGGKNKKSVQGVNHLLGEVFSHDPNVSP